LFAIAGLFRTSPDVGEAFTMLTMPPGPDIAPYHNRQVAVLHAEHVSAWLDATVPAKEALKPLPAASLDVEQVC
jgi:putative SOS response-associated peptidase YedK